MTYLEVFVGSSNLQVRVAQFTKQPMWNKLPSWDLFKIEFHCLKEHVTLGLLIACLYFNDLKKLEIRTVFFTWFFPDCYGLFSCLKLRSFWKFWLGVCYLFWGPGDWEQGAEKLLIGGSPLSGQGSVWTPAPSGHPPGSLPPSPARHREVVTGLRHQPVPVLGWWRLHSPVTTQADCGPGSVLVLGAWKGAALSPARAKAKQTGCRTHLTCESWDLGPGSRRHWLGVHLASFEGAARACTVVEVLCCFLSHDCLDGVRRKMKSYFEEGVAFLSKVLMWSLREAFPFLKNKTKQNSHL